MSFKKHLARAVTVAAAGVAMLGLTACSTAIKGADALNTAATSGPAVKTLVKVGFVTFGAGDGWHAANEADIKASFTKEAGFDLEYASTASTSQKSQIDAFNSFVDEGVNIILLSARDASGWEGALTRAQAAEIPVVLINGAIEPDKTSLYATRIAPSEAGAAAAAANWALATFPEGAKYFVLEDASGTAAVTESNTGWDGVMAPHPEFVKIGAESANGSIDEAKSATATMLAANGNDVALIIAHSDQMALGAAQAVEEAGLVPGTNVKIVTIGGSKDAMQALFDGRLSFVGETTPLLGLTAVKVVKTIIGGSTIDPLVAVPSAGFALITQEQLDALQY